MLLILVGGSPAQAVPQLPHIFFGNVFIGTDPNTAQPAAAGTAIQARIDSVNFANSSDTGRNTRTDAGGTYGQTNNFHVCGNTTDIAGKQGGDPGEAVEFFIANKLAVARDASGNVVDPVLFQPGQTTLLDLYQDPTASAVAETGSAEACKIGATEPASIPSVGDRALIALGTLLGVLLLLRIRRARKPDQAGAEP